MKRVEEKVKDIVEVRSFANLADLSADPAATLAGYRFTDITADLMGKWLDAVSSVSPGAGAAFALAGFRGVGKSHFLSTLGALVSNVGLREQIPDQYVANAASRLPRRGMQVLIVHRGLRASLLEELRASVAALTATPETELNDFAPRDLLQFAAGGGSITVLVDTAMERERRVSRDDGPMLADLAKEAVAQGLFLGVALDDDIAGADGANLAISGSFKIDYLDQEHLYKIVDAHIFSKKESALPLLHSIYQYYHDELPQFRWSEQRFISLYPLHPAALEVAPLIRLYLHEFALLGFAAEAGVKILGRPANSLIGIDEVFDSVETRLRGVKELEEAFAAFDQLDREVISKAPVNVRLFAKLILKGLFMSSLDGGGTSADALAAAMLVVTEAGSSLNIEGLLDSFATHLPASIVKMERDGGETKYAFKLRFAEDLKAVLDVSETVIDPEALAAMLVRLAGEKYSDMVLAEDGATSKATIEWRGSLREGEINWDISGRRDGLPSKAADWTVFVRFGPQEDRAATAGRLNIDWILADLTDDETETLRRLHILQTDPSVRAQFKERAAAEVQIHALAAEKIWKRIFLSDAKLMVDGVVYPFGEEASRSHTLAHLFGEMLQPVFEYRYPKHPSFARTLRPSESQSLIAQFFGNAAGLSAETQELAKTFAVPLGLAVADGDRYAPAPAPVLTQLPIVQSIFAQSDIREDSVVPIAEISQTLTAVPVGLSKEAQRLVMSSLVAARELIFVTSSGNRINHRSLDLQILWEDVAGVSKAAAEVYAADRLLEWARAMTGNKQIRSIDRPDDRIAMVDTLSGWLSNWRQARFLEAFDRLSDENLNSNIWRTASALRRTFEAVAGSIEELVAGTMPLDACLRNIADLFYDSIEDYEQKKKDLLVLRYFIEAADKRGEIIRYLSVTETTDDQELEALRKQLLDRTGPSFFAADPALNADLDNLWQGFKTRYIAHYLQRHNAAMNSTEAVETLKEVMSTDKWAAFHSFSDLPWFDRYISNEATAVIRNIRHMTCAFDTEAILATRPSCSCSFRLASFERRKDGPLRLTYLVDHGLASFADRANKSRSELRSVLKGQLGPTLTQCLESGFSDDLLTRLSAYETVVLKNAIAVLRTPGDNGAVAAEPLSLGPRDWENEIDSLDIFAENR